MLTLTGFPAQATVSSLRNWKRAFYRCNALEERAWSAWNQEQLKEWLGQHGIQVPKGYTREQLSDLVQANWYAGTTWTSQQVEGAKDLYKSVKERSFDS